MRCLFQLALDSSTLEERAAAKDDLPQSFGDYELEEELARGGMGIVYRARQVSLDRPVALKMILAGQFASEAELKRFRTEAQAAANLDHPNIVSIFEVGEHEGRSYFSMKLIEGGSLSDHIARFRVEDYKSAERAARMLATVARAIHHAHQRGILHRDLKPSNILIDVQDQPQVADFGLAKRLGHDSNLTRSEAVMGTPNYMAPEQALGKMKELTTAADVYSLGAILYLLLTGKPPFQGATPLETIRKLTELEPERPTSIHPHIDRDLETICLKCLEKAPKQRYTSAEACAEDLERWLRHEPILARPSTILERTRKFMRRRPAIAALIVVAGLAAITSSLLGLHAMRSARLEVRERLRAQALLYKMELRQAEGFLAKDEAPAALALLADVLRHDPTNRLATDRLMFAMTQRDFALPTTRPLLHAERVLWAEYSPDGARIVTACADHTARVWDAISGSQVIAPLKHAGEVRSAHFSADGRKIATSSEDGTGRVWDAQTGQPITPPLGHSNRLYSIQFSPDGMLVVTASADNNARVWNAQTGEPVTGWLKHKENVRKARFSPDGEQVLTVSWDRTARLWSARTGARMGSPLSHSTEVFDGQFSPSGRWIATASSDRTALLWEVGSGQPWGPPVKHSQQVEVVQFSPDETRLITGSWDRTAHIWNLEANEPHAMVLPHNGAVHYAEFSPDGQRAITASLDKSARVWDVETGQALGDPLRHDATVYSARFSPDGQRVVTASFDGTAQIWDVGAGSALAEYVCLTNSVSSVDFSSDGLRLITRSGNMAQLWEVRTGKPLGRPLQHTNRIHHVAFSPNGDYLATASADETARIWDGRTGEPLSPALSHRKPVRHVQFSPDGALLLTAGNGGRATFWRVPNGERLGASLTHKGFINKARFSPDGQQIVTASSDETACVWNVQTRQRTTKPLLHDSIVDSAEFSPDGRGIVTVPRDSAARIWNAKTGEPLGARLQHNGEVKTAHFSPNGQRIVTASFDKTARIWDSQTGKPLTDPLQHQDTVVSAEFSPDGQSILTASLDGTARVWDAETGLPITELKHETAVNSARFSPDGQMIVTGCADGTARFWPLRRAPLPIPPWFAELAEALGGQKLNAKGTFDSVSPTELLTLKERLGSRSGTDFYAHWVQWFFADRRTRAISPFSDITVPEYVQSRLDENRTASLKEAIRLSPTNAVAHARMAKHALVTTSLSDSQRVRLAEWYSHRAAKLAPNNQEVRETRLEVEKLTKQRDSGNRNEK